MAFSVSRVSRQQVLRVIVHVAAWVAVGAVHNHAEQNCHVALRRLPNPEGQHIKPAV